MRLKKPHRVPKWNFAVMALYYCVTVKIKQNRLQQVIDFIEKIKCETLVKYLNGDVKCMYITER